MLCFPALRINLNFCVDWWGRHIMNMKSAAKITVAGFAILNASTALSAPVKYVRIQDVYKRYNWTGGYFGGSVGGIWQSVNYDAPPFLNDSVSPASIYGGVVAGYNYQFGSNWVVGLEGDLGLLNASDDSIINFIDISTRSTWQGSISARLGVVIDEHWFAYLKTGVGFTNQTVDLGFNQSDRFTRTGWVVGGGLEYALPGTSWSMRLEYLHTDYGSRTFVQDVATKLYSDMVRAALVTHVNKWDR
jgi:outer membrane immunogenic protein